MEVKILKFIFLIINIKEMSKQMWSRNENIQEWVIVILVIVLAIVNYELCIRRESQRAYLYGCIYVNMKISMTQLYLFKKESWCIVVDINLCILWLRNISNLFSFFFPVVMLVTVEKDPWKAENKKNGDFLVSENFTFLPTY